jgi:pilus assembly protein Flp/PilA
MDKDIKSLEMINKTEEEKGASMLEYALLAALIAVVCIAAITFLGAQASQAFSKVGGNIQSAG